METTENKTSLNKDKLKKKLPNKKVTIILIVAILLLVGVGVFYRFAKNRISDVIVGRSIEKVTGGDVKVKDGGKTINYVGEEGEFNLETENKLVEDFPSDFPIYPQATLQSSWSAKTESNEGTSAIWETSSDLSEVVAFYQKSLEQEGWKISSSFIEETFSTLSFDKGGEKGMLALSSDDGKVTISVTFGIE